MPWIFNPTQIEETLLLIEKTVLSPFRSTFVDDRFLLLEKNLQEPGDYFSASLFPLVCF